MSLKFKLLFYLLHCLFFFAAVTPSVTPCHTPPATPPPQVINKMRESSKRKAAILLPMGVPAKKGRGSAVPMPISYASKKYQKILQKRAEKSEEKEDVETQQAETLASMLTEEAPDMAKALTAEGSEEEVSAMYYTSISDHAYCQNFNLEQTMEELIAKDMQHNVAKEVVIETVAKEDVCEVEVVEEEMIVGVTETESSVLQHLQPGSKKLNTDNLTVVDMDIVDEDENIVQVKRFDKFTSENGHVYQMKPSEQIEFRDPSKGHKNRSYRRHSPSPESDKEQQYYDRLPTYFSVLKKTNQLGQSENPFSKITLNDNLPDRDPSPEREKDSLYDKLPAYYSCFTNSTKFDNGSSGTSQEVQKKSSKLGSTYSSRSVSPLFIDTQPPSRNSSRSRSFSRSRSRSFSRSSSRSSYSSRSSQSRSRSRSRSR